jgi:uncharacterized membrane protein YqgA involved in biofilm formation
MDRIKNVLTNILGLVFWGVAIKNASSLNPSISFVLSMTITGFILFLFKVKITIDFVKRFINKKIDNVK